MSLPPHIAYKSTAGCTAKHTLSWYALPIKPDEHCIVVFPALIQLFRPDAILNDTSGNAATGKIGDYTVVVAVSLWQQQLLCLSSRFSLWAGGKAAVCPFALFSYMKSFIASLNFSSISENTLMFLFLPAMVIPPESLDVDYKPDGRKTYRCVSTRFAVFSSGLTVGETKRKCPCLEPRNTGISLVFTFWRREWDLNPR